MALKIRLQNARSFQKSVSGITVRQTIEEKPILIDVLSLHLKTFSSLQDLTDIWQNFQMLWSLPKFIAILCTFNNESANLVE